MSKPFQTRDLQFYMTAPGPCPYLPDRFERKVFTDLSGPDAPEIADALVHAGFRRSQNVAYRPACETCNLCVSTRVRAWTFEPGRGQRRVLKRNSDLVATTRRAPATMEQFTLFSRYLHSRHNDGGMTEMTFGDYAVMVGDSPVATVLTEYRRGAGGPLLAAAISDQLHDGMSLVYSFFEPDEHRRSLGAFMILDHIRRAAAAGWPYVYLGYWIKGSAKMDYKAQYRPMEVLRPSGWRLLEDDD